MVLFFLLLPFAFVYERIGYTIFFTLDAVNGGNVICTIR